MDIILLGEPRTTNKLYKTRFTGKFPIVYMSKEGKDLKKSYIEQAQKQWTRKPITGDIQIWIEIFFGTKRKCDWDNFHKLSMDALTGIVWEDDSQIVEATVVKLYDKENPRIEITIKEL